ncbi:MAG TPA: DnaJ C-terminal domain-containing protein, partial [Acidimicrobiales bacterium]
PEKRTSYDEVRKMGPMAGAGFGAPGGRGAPGGPGAPGGAGARNFTFTGDDLGGVFGDLFSRLRPDQGTGRATGQAGPQRGADLEAELHLSFTDAVNGITTAVNVTSEATCHTCHGSGAAPGTSPVVCPQCAGRGVLDENQGFFSFSRACPRCGGRGMVVESPCPNCGGAGVELRPRQVKVRIPAGVANDQRIRLKGRGSAGRNGGPPGDLYVKVRVAPHPIFGRRGNDLTIKVPITFPESALGAEIKVPTLDDAPVTVKIPPGTKSGRTFRVRNRGVIGSKGTGDLLVTVEVAVPTKLSSAEREAIEALAAAVTESPRTHLGV